MNELTVSSGGVDLSLICLTERNRGVLFDIKYDGEYLEVRSKSGLTYLCTPIRLKPGDEITFKLKDLDNV